jgi:hypothetical protein
LSASSSGAIFISGGTQSVQVVSNPDGGNVGISFGRAFTGTLGGETLFARVVLGDVAANPGSFEDIKFELSGDSGFGSGASFGYYTPSSATGLNVQNPDGSSSDSGVSIPVVAGENNLLVAEFVWDPTVNSGAGGYTEAELFLNPDSTNLAALTPVATIDASTYASTLGDGFDLGTANGSGTFNVDSFAITSSYASAVAPEPSSVALMMVGGLGLLGFVIRQRRLSA